MANLLPLHMPSPGQAGVNLQDNDGVLSPAWATVANNLVLNKKNRLSLRPGTMMVDETNAPTSIRRLHSHIDGLGGVHQLLQKGSSQVYELISGTWTALTLLRDAGSNLCFSDAFKFQSFNGKCIVVGRDPSNNYHIAHVQNTPGSNFTFLANLPTGASECLAAWGRVWVVDRTKLYWSNLLDETTWTPADFIDLTDVWPNGADEPVGLAEYNGNLVILGQRSIVVYGSPDQVAAGNMEKIEALDGIGLLSRDLIQNTGEDLLFMSQGGLVRFSRVIQEKSMPLQKAGNNVDDSILDQFNSHVFYAEDASSAFDKRTGNMFIKVMASDAVEPTIYIANTNVSLPDASIPMTTINYDSTAAVYFDSDTHLSLYESGDPTEHGIWVTAYVVSEAKYVPCVMTQKLTVDAATDLNGTAGVAINEIEYRSGWLDFAELELEDFEKILKKARVAIENAAGYSMVLKYWLNYDDSTTYTETLTVPSNNTVEQVYYNIGHKGQYVKLGVYIADVSDSVTLSRNTLYVKRGKVAVS